MILNGVMAVTLRYFTEFGKPALLKTIFTALHGKQARSSNENSVCLSNVWIVTKQEKSVEIFIPYKGSFTLVF